MCYDYFTCTSTVKQRIAWCTIQQAHKTWVEKAVLKPNEVSRYVYKLGNETEKYTVNASGSCKNMVLQKSWMSNVNEIKDLRVNNIQNICPQK